MKLVRTPRPRSQESLAGYILRICEKNGYHSPSLFIGAYRWKASGVYHLTAKELSSWTAIPEDDFSEVVIRHEKSTGMRYTTFGPSLMLNAHLDLDAVAVCPECVGHDLPHLAVFHIKWVVACPLHRKALIRKCPACKTQLNSVRPSLTTCRYGHDVLEKFPPRPLDPNYLDLLSVMHEAFDEGVAMNVPEEASHLRGISTLSLCTLLDALTNLVLEPHQPIIEKTPITGGSTVPLSAVPWLLTSWPHNLHRYLDAREGLNNET
ncbi:TniQ family protein [Xanthomonas phaseoli pv. dieffenbachiae]|uniref:TniQ family protein n=2 Tax=Xanthomonas TaxID=338 RepID=UPI001ADAA300|nr:TniQ family protein [Xanthomonas sp. D-36-1]MBO9749534.1 TniQ family protein [Xanthomonas phaseoli pv. dieffenbachiae]MBO9753604.1 TniQ family protein [Xanthomonas phaseoli pv. dieffenbachiae]MBO9892087.1 TniQ family protein [Xanthomonas sp. D-36-1]